MMHFVKKRILFFICLFFILLQYIFPITANIYSYPVFRVVLDPGHGGVSWTPLKKHGDRYDTLSENYLDYYKSGAAYGGLHENKIVYQIAKKVKALLYHCSPNGDFSKFESILDKYIDGYAKKIFIATGLSRKESLTFKSASKLKDPNEQYRIFDFPGTDGAVKPGRLTRINNMQPHLVVSLHVDTYKPNYLKGINPFTNNFYPLR